MDTNDTPAPSPADDPRSEANIARRRAMGIAERAPNGQLYPGSRIPGAGRKPDAENITALARVHTQRAIEVLREVIDDPKAAQAAKVAAAQALLDRGWGKAPIQVDVTHRANFADFLRDVGISARYEHDHPALLRAVIDEVLAEDADPPAMDDDVAG